MKSLFAVEGKVALVTGGSSGIGLMIARGFVHNGVRTYISSRSAEVCGEVAAELSKVGACRSIPADLSSMEGVYHLAQELASREHRLNILVNNAGTTSEAPLETFPESEWDRVMDLNLKSLFFLTRELLPLLRAQASPQDPARVINIGSIDGLRVPRHDAYPYAASKAAVHHLTCVLARKFAPYHVNVNAVAPGVFESKLTKADLERSRDSIVNSVPCGRIGEPEDMAGVAIFLASRAGAYVTGTVIPVDGGWSNCVYWA